MNMYIAIFLILNIILVGINIYFIIYGKKTLNKLKENDKEVASTMIMNFKEYDKYFEDNAKEQSDIKRDNKAIMNELHSIQNAITVLNNGFTIPSMHNN